MLMIGPAGCRQDDTRAETAGTLPGLTEEALERSRLRFQTEHRRNPACRLASHSQWLKALQRRGSTREALQPAISIEGRGQADTGNTSGFIHVRRWKDERALRAAE